MATQDGTQEVPEGVFSLLDTDLYKLTMQNAIFKFFPDVQVAYKFTNRTKDMHLNKSAYEWLQKQIEKLENITITSHEIHFLTEHCPYLTPEFLIFLKTFKLHPKTQVKLKFQPVSEDSEEGDISLSVNGRWLDTILYEIPLLALVSESYFKFVDTDWDHQGQVEKAKAKGLSLMEAGCVFSEFGSRRRRDYHTHELVMQGLVDAQKEAQEKGLKGKLAGTSNVHFAMKYGVNPVGTVAHEWFMGIAAILNDYTKANETALQYWIGTFGRGTLSIALTDTFGTPNFLEAFKRHAPPDYMLDPHASEPPPNPMYAAIFTGTRQDSGSPTEFVKLMKNFYEQQGIKDRKTIVFSDSLNVEKCIEYKQITDEAGLTPSFGVGTFFTNDFVRKTSGNKSVPLNIVIKLSEAEGRPAVKISDNLGKNTGDSHEVARVKRELGYVEKNWEGGDESSRWGKENDLSKARAQS